MARMLALVLGLAILAFVVKTELTHSAGPVVSPQIETGIKPVEAAGPGNGEHTVQRQELDNVRARSHELEKEMQQRVDQNAGAADEQR